MATLYDVLSGSGTENIAITEDQRNALVKLLSYGRRQRTQKAIAVAIAGIVSKSPAPVYRHVKLQSTDPFVNITGTDVKNEKRQLVAELLK